MHYWQKYHRKGFVLLSGAQDAGLFWVGHTDLDPSVIYNGGMSPYLSYRFPFVIHKLLMGRYFETV